LLPAAVGADAAAAVAVAAADRRAVRERLAAEVADALAQDRMKALF
jgi:hypothetical protein